MPFPSAPRIVYKNNPLDKVVCQIRFPPILRIDSSPPADFQDRIRDVFPNFNESSEFAIEQQGGMGENIPIELFRQVIQSSGTKNYEFASADGIIKINLTRTFIALTTSHYQRWELFRENMAAPYKALMELYSPTYSTRIGLRYTDIFRRSLLGLTDVPWSDLLSQELIGVLGSPVIADFVDEFESIQVIKLAEKLGYARVRAKIIKDGEEQIFVLDSDFFDTTKSDISKVLEKLDFFNSRSTRFIRWAIKDKLHTALEPSEL